MDVVEHPPAIERDPPPPDVTRKAGSKALSTLAVLAVAYTVYFAAAILLPFTLAIVLYLLLSPAMRFLNKRLHIPRALGALLLIIVLFAVVGGIAAAISVPATEWVARIPQSLPTIQQKFHFLQGPVAYLQHGYDRLSGMIGGGGGSSQGGGIPGISSLTSLSGAIFSGLKNMLADGFTILLLLYFFLYAGDTLLRRLVEVLPTWEDKRRAVQIASEIEDNVASYLATITVMNTLVGILNGRTSDSAMNNVASTAVPRVSRLAVPRPDMNDPMPWLWPMPRPPPSLRWISTMPISASVTSRWMVSRTSIIAAL